MYQVKKVLNNNSIVASQNDMELILLAKGIGFCKKIGDTFYAPRDVKVYVMSKDNNESKSSEDIVQDIDPIYIEIASEIIKYTSEVFEAVDTHILLALADHIDFAIRRLKEGIMITNPFTSDIHLLFPDEYQVALKGKQYIYKRTNVMISDDEVGYITLHVHSAISNHRVHTSMEATQIIHDSIEQLKKDLKIEIDIHSISYIRLMNHIKFLFARLCTDEQLQMDISDFTKERFPFAYNQAENICVRLSQVLNKSIPQSEIGYLALHLERVLSISIQREKE